jgi:precorrin-8X/cobalt-precorrin-8 methylmutase
VTLFDRYIAVDWSANNTPKSGRDSIWAGVGTADADSVETTNITTRRGAETWLLRRMRQAVRARERVLVGLDFPYGYPEGFAAILSRSDESWRGVWTYLAEQISDDGRNVSNRFEVAAGINRRLQRHAPFWGRPESLRTQDLSTRKDVSYHGHRNGGLSEWRQVEDNLRRNRKHPQSVWKLAYPGSVGSQALVGIPVVHRLRWHPELRDVSKVWPFEVAVPDLGVGEPGIVHAEIWPSVAPFDHEIGSCADEQQVRAVVSYWRKLDVADRIGGLFAAAPNNDAVRGEEGWILGVAPPEEYPELIPARQVTTARRDKASAESRRRSRQSHGDNPCGCGCGAPGPGRFRPGHDAKLRSQLLKRIADGDAQAAKIMTDLGWY